MYTGLSHLHHYLPYILFFLMGLVILKSIKGMINQEEYTESDKKAWIVCYDCCSCAIYGRYSAVLCESDGDKYT